MTYGTTKLQSPPKRLKSDRKETCPCCCNVESKWLYWVYGMWYCVPCLRGIYGHGPAWIRRCM